MKHNFYLKHSLMAAFDPRMEQLLREKGLKGFGAYWFIVEKLAMYPDMCAQPESLKPFCKCSEVSFAYIQKIIFEHEELFVFYEDGTFAPAELNPVGKKVVVKHRDTETRRENLEKKEEKKGEKRACRTEKKVEEKRQKTTENRSKIIENQQKNAENCPKRDENLQKNAENQQKTSENRQKNAKKCAKNDVKISANALKNSILLENDTAFYKENIKDIIETEEEKEKEKPSPSSSAADAEILEAKCRRPVPMGKVCPHGYGRPAVWMRYLAVPNAPPGRDKCHRLAPEMRGICA